MDNSVVTIILIIYSIWAIYSGWKVISDRSVWLDTKAPVNTIVKIILSIALGYVIGAFYLIYLILKLIFHF